MRSHGRAGRQAGGEHPGVGGPKGRGRAVLLALLAVAGTGPAAHAAAPGEAPPAAVPPAAASGPAQAHLEQIRGLIDKRQYYAALAYIEAEPRAGASGEELTFLEAEARRLLDQRPAAAQLYRRLLAGSYAARAYHGLGLIELDQDNAAAIADFRHAVQAAPTDADFRSDLGRALMGAGRYAEALPELSTAAELAPTDAGRRNDLIVLMLLMDNKPAVTHLVAVSATSPETLLRLRDQARMIRRKQAAHSGKAG